MVENLLKLPTDIKEKILRLCLAINSSSAAFQYIETWLDNRNGNETQEDYIAALQAAEKLT